MMYLQATTFLPLILKADRKGTSLYIDGAHAVHVNVKGRGQLNVNSSISSLVWETSPSCIICSKSIPY